jgi:hypothetical protein
VAILEPPSTTYTFQMLFSGLCAFVPDTDIDKTSPSQMDVLLVNTDHDDKSFLKFEHEEDHFALLKYNLGDTPGGIVAEDRDSQGFWTLNAEHLTIEVRKHGSAAPSPPRAFTLGDVTALPRIDKIFPPAKTLHPEALGNNPSRIKARLRITQGTLKQFTIGQFLNTDITVQFVPPPPGGVLAPPQTLATKIALTLELDPSEEVVIHSKAFGINSSPADPDVRTLALNPQPAGGAVEVSLVNLCCGYFMDKRTRKSETPRQDTDFEFFYILANDLPNFVKHAQYPIPVPVGYRAEPLPPLANDHSGGGGETARCNMALFNQGGHP